MRTTYMERIARFGFGLLATALLLTALLRLQPGAPVDLSRSIATKRPVAELVSQMVPNTAAALATNLAIALPLALLLGIPAGLRPHSKLDHLLQGAAVALMGVPAVVAAPLAISSLAVKSRAFSIPNAAMAGLICLLAGWLARAIRNGLADSRPDGAPVAWGRAVVAMLGRILQQTGNYIALVMLASFLAGGPQGGIWRLVVQAAETRDLPVVYRALWIMLLAVLIGHLAGDLLVAAAVKEGERPVGRISRSWLILGGLLTAILLVLPLLGGDRPGAVDIANVLHPPGPGHLLGTDQLGRDVLSRLGAGARVSLTIAGAATLLAAVPAGLLATLGWAGGDWGQAILTPRTAVPNLLGPMVAGLVGALVFKPSVMILIVSLGIASIPAMVLAFRQIYGPGRTITPMRRALPALCGVVVLTFAQVLLAEGALSFLGLGVLPPMASLGSLASQAAQFLHQAPWQLWAALPGAAGIAGLFLIGHSLAGTSRENL